VGKHVNGHPAAGCTANAVAGQQVATLLEAAERVGQRLGVGENRPRADHPFLSKQRRSGGQLLDTGGDAYPFVGVGGDVGM
jgi:hypothetical protein